MNEISFKDFNKSVLHNNNILNGPQLSEATTTTTKKEVTLKTPSTVVLKTAGGNNNNMSTMSVGAAAAANRSSRAIAATTSDRPKEPFYPPGVNSTTSKSMRKTVADNNLLPYDNDKDTLFSTWTPLSDEGTNNRV